MVNQSLTSFEKMLMAVIALLIGMRLASGPVESVSNDTTIEFDLTKRGSQVQTRIPAIKVLYKEGRQLLLQMNMEDYRHARFEVVFTDAEFSGWCVNIGDSPSNDGWRGDGADFSHDAELQVAGENGGLAVYGNDYTSNDAVNNENAQLVTERNFATAATAANIEIGNHFVSWDNFRGKKGKLDSEFLFGLDSQYDAEHDGPNDKMIYAAFNRVISGRSDRDGSCVDRVRVTLVR